MIEIGIDSFATAIAPPGSGVDIQPDHLIENLLTQVELADSKQPLERPRRSAQTRPPTHPIAFG